MQTNSEFTKNDKEITIGRTSDNTIRIKSQALSRTQCKFECTENGWMICDGNGIKKSTNGTWLYVDDPFEMYDSMLLKAGDLLFKVYLGN